ncbi:hypothetical protein NEMBOFW57_007407 [Staphylotrichum longicolle]|uniref:Fe2OG dioxygenase domain-containing protein n=1 Tax=Staphylotrichum longicolle TaxID=669026 RepID=A0AAD4EV23_9PEZI|nr:hypothetical protein NEMBOFW57_007407 [Staphylotrichum longicolle]
MDAFVTRKKRKSSPQVAPVSCSTDCTESHEESTDIKLAILSSLHPSIDQEVLLDILLAHDGNVEATSQSLKTTRLPKKTGVGHAVAAQSSLRSYAVSPAISDLTPSSKRVKLLSRKGATLHLYDPQDISEHTPCTIIHNFLPAEEANALLQELLRESESFERITFKLFDNVVSSPHTSGFFVGTHKELQEQKHEYVYNGSRMTDVRTLTPQLERVKARVQEAVNREVEERIRTRYGGKKLKYQSPKPWTPNAAFVNCYNGPQESVGWHSDQLTYLGPRPIIGSLSLGVAREFRVRRIVPQDDKNDDGGGGDEAGQIAIHLPHNSLLVMHADMQEGWKHSVAPRRPSIPTRWPARGASTSRTATTAAASTRATPRAARRCGVPAVLRVVSRKRENWGRYFWMCHAGNVPGKEACGFFRWAEFDDDGEPVGVEGGVDGGKEKDGERKEDREGKGGREREDNEQD